MTSVPRERYFPMKGNFGKKKKRTKIQNMGWPSFFHQGC